MVKTQEVCFVVTCCDTIHKPMSFPLNSQFSWHLLLVQLVNKEMFWVVTEICNEINVVKRSKIIKHFIKIASEYMQAENVFRLNSFDNYFSTVAQLFPSQVRGSATSTSGDWKVMEQGIEL